MAKGFNNYITGVIIAIVIIVVYFILTCNKSKYEKYMYGFWIGDESFCEESETESMLLFIGEPVDNGFTFSKSRNSYIIINDAEGPVCNQSFVMDYYSDWSGPTINNYVINPKLEFEEDDVFPCNVTMSFDMCRGLLRIYSDGVMYGVFHKENQVTNALQ